MVIVKQNISQFFYLPPPHKKTFSQPQVFVAPGSGTAGSLRKVPAGIAGGALGPDAKAHAVAVAFCGVRPAGENDRRTEERRRIHILWCPGCFAICLCHKKIPIIRRPTICNLFPSQKISILRRSKICDFLTSQKISILKKSTIIQTFNIFEI